MARKRPLFGASNYKKKTKRKRPGRISQKSCPRYYRELSSICLKDRRTEKEGTKSEGGVNSKTE